MSNQPTPGSFRTATRPIRSVIIVGAGFSGTLLAINLLRHEAELSVLLVEKRNAFGRGVAYSSLHDDHLLNVRAGNMSALPDDPGHFVRWFSRRGGDAGQFARRKDYGQYLSELLAESAAAAQGRLQLIQGQAVEAIPRDGGVLVRVDDGRILAGDALVMALGNLAPSLPPNLDPAGLPPDVCIRDPWGEAPADKLEDEDTVLLLGTGLTMVDVALSLSATGWRGRMLALSRRGLLPHPHAAAHHASAGPPPGTVPPLAARPHGRPAQLLRQTRQRAALRGWHAAIDELRPFTQSMWAAASAPERAQFLRHLRPWWDIHRHRLAPAIAEQLHNLTLEGRLRIAAGKLLSVAADGRDAAVVWRPRGSRATENVVVRRIVNCIGPSGDVAAADDPLLRSLLTQGLARPDPLRLGLDVDSQSNLIGVDSRPVPGLHALGPMTRGAFWEITAVPDIRQQAWSLARRLCSAHWVGGDL